MAVASLHLNGEQVAMRGFHPPKKATVTAWYRAATAQMDEAPEWRTVDMSAAVVEADTITFHGQGWDLFIARKRFLK